jgi:hypothetical protein
MNEPSMGEPRIYRPGPGWTALLAIVGLFVMGCGVAIVLQTAGAGARDSHTVALLAGFATLCVMMGLYLVLYVVENRIRLFPDRIEFQHVLHTRTIHREDIAGWRFQQSSQSSSLVFQLRGGGYVRVPTFFQFDSAFLRWRDSLPNLDEVARKASEAEILADPNFGATPEERSGSLQRGRVLATVFSVVGAAAGFWGMIYPHPYWPLMAFLVVLPLLAVGAVGYSRGLLRMNLSPRSDAHPALLIPFLFPSLALVIRGLSDFRLLNAWEGAAWWSLGAGLAVLAITWTVDPSVRANARLTILIGFLCCGYGFGIVAAANGLFDRSAPVLYTPRVTGKYIRRGKSTSYNLRLEPWGPVTGPTQVSVSRSLYGSTSAGDTVCASLREGALGFKWYRISACR